MEAIDNGSAQRNIPKIATGIGVLVVPGALFMLATWIAEQQLGNLVEETAIAAGVKAPQILLMGRRKRTPPSQGS